MASERRREINQRRQRRAKRLKKAAKANAAANPTPQPAAKKA